MSRVTFRMFDFFSSDGLQIGEVSLSGTENRAVYADKVTGDKVILEGRNLDYGKEGLVDGQVNKLLIVDASGEKFQLISDFKLSARVFSGDDMVERLEGIMGRILKANDVEVWCTRKGDDIIGWGGDDIIHGRGGGDLLGGGAGKDILTGGAGSDVFVFEAGNDRDRVTDFDADDSDGMQDHIQASLADVLSIEKSGKNTVLDFGDGDILTLEHVKPGQIDASDFV